MNYTFKMIRRVAGKNIKSLYLPIVLSCVDALLHMGMFSTMIMTIIELIGGVFTMQRLTLYGVILVLLFLMRAILFSINYTQVQYRGADISAQQRLSLGDHIRSLNLGYFNKNSIGRLMSTLTTDITSPFYRIIDGLCRLWLLRQQGQRRLELLKIFCILL